MSGPNEQMASIFKDLGIDASNWLENPKEFAEIMRIAASKLDKQLGEKNSVVTQEEKFKAKSLKDPKANALADEFIEKFTDAFTELSPEVLCCILVRIPELTKNIRSGITAMAMRQEKTFSKKRIHGMYNDLRKAYEKYVSFMKQFRASEIGNPPNIPARPGNYGTESSSVVDYMFFINGEKYYNYYEVANQIGLYKPGNATVHYMDVVDAFRAAKNGEINGLKVELKTMDNYVIDRLDEIFKDKGTPKKEEEEDV